VLGPGQLLEQFRAVLQAGVDLAALAQPGLPASLLEHQLDHRVGQARALLPGPGVGRHVAIPAFGQREPAAISCDQAMISQCPACRPAW
jgi:hypothetical protein